MKVTESGATKHRQLQIEDYLQRVSAEQKEYAGVCEPPKMTDAKGLVQRLDEWIRSRIRMVTWKRWKRARTRYANLKGLGIKEEQAWMWANTRKGYWRIAHGPILLTALSIERFKQNGYLGLTECYSAK